MKGLPTKAHLLTRAEIKKNGWSDDTRCVIDECILLEYAATFLPVNQAALVEAVSKGTIELPGGMLLAMGQDHIVLKAAEHTKHDNEPPRIVAFTPLSEVHRAIERSLAAWYLGKLAEECMRDSIERARGTV